MRIGYWRLDSVSVCVIDGIAGNDHIRSHAGHIPLLVVRGKHDIFTDLAVRNVDDFYAVRIHRQIDDTKFRFTERRQVKLGRVAVVKNVVRDEIRRQRNVHEYVAVVCRLRVHVENGDALFAALRAERHLQIFQ